MPLNIWQELANAAPKPQPKPAKRRVLRKPKAVYTKGTVRSNRTTTRRAPAPAPRRTSPAPSYRGPAPSGGGGGGGGGGGLSMPSMGGGSMASVASLLAQMRKEAAKQVDMELNPQIGARQYAFNQSRSAYGNTYNELHKRFGLTKAEVTQLYGALDALLGAGNLKRQQAMDTARGQSNTAYDELAQMVGQKYAQAQSATASEQARLGQANPAADDRLAADATFAQGQVGAGKANAASTIDAIKAAAAAEGQTMRGAAQATAPMLIGQAQLGRDQNLAEAKKLFDADAGRLKFEISQIKGSRAAKIDQLAREMAAAEQQRQADAQQQAFMNSLQLGRYGIEQQQLWLDTENSRNSQVLRAKELAAKLAGTAAGPQTGMERSYSYLQSGYKGAVPQAQLQQALEDAINGNSNDPNFNPMTPGPGNIPGYDPRFLDQYRRDLRTAAAQRGWSQTELNALLNAAGYYFKR
jgi:hypothetical protein